MSIFASASQTATGVPIDNALSPFYATNVQDALDEIRHQSIWNPTITATTASGTLTLVSTNDSEQILTGSAAGFSVVLPNATTLFNGRKFEIVNSSTNPITIKDGSGATLFTLGQNSIGFITLQSNASTAGVWVQWQTYIGTAGGILNYNLISSTAFVTSSTSDVLITGFSLTPAAGTYAVFYSASVFQTTSPVVVGWTIYAGGVAVTDSVRSQQSARSNQTMFENTQTIIQVNGAQAIDVRVNTASGSLTVNQRSLLLIRLGN